MPKALSLDIRHRIIRYVASGHSCRKAAARFDVAPSIAIKLVSAYRRSGSYAPRPMGGWRHSKLDPHGAFLERRIAEKPDITMSELAVEMAAKGVTVAPASLSRWLIRHGYRYKKNAAGIGARSPRDKRGA
jgi:transposase